MLTSEDSSSIHNRMLRDWEAGVSIPMKQRFQRNNDN
jgi:hypothetical protein